MGQWSKAGLTVTVFLKSKLLGKCMATGGGREGEGVSEHRFFHPVSSWAPRIVSGNEDTRRGFAKLNFTENEKSDVDREARRR